MSSVFYLWKQVDFSKRETTGQKHLCKLRLSRLRVPISTTNNYVISVISQINTSSNNALLQLHERNRGLL